MDETMNKVKPYKIEEAEGALIASEPVAAYGYAPSDVQALRNRIVNTVNETKDENLLMECLELLHADTMPCVYTDKEFEEELRLSETSGSISHEEALKYFEKWGFVR